jgi:hypothetical protein
MLTTFTPRSSWVDQGYSVIPIGYKDKRPAFERPRLAGAMATKAGHRGRHTKTDADAG